MKMKAEETEAKYTLVWSGEKVRNGLMMFKNALDELDIPNLDVQNKRLVTLTMDNLFTAIMTACEVIRNLKKEVKMP